MKTTKIKPLALIAALCIATPLGSKAQQAPPLSMEMIHEFKETFLDEDGLKSNAFIDKYGMKAYFGMLMCLSAYEMHEQGKTSALTDNYEHKLEWMQRLRRIFQNRNRIKPGDNKLEGQEKEIVDGIIHVAKTSYCPDAK